MPIEIYGSDEAGHLMLMPDPTPERPPSSTVPPAGEPPLPGADAPPVDAAPAPPADELAALRRLIEARAESDRARELRDADLGARLDTMTRIVSGQAPALPETPPAGPTPRPSAEAFARNDDYVEAMTDWKTEEKLTAYHAAQQQAMQEARQAAAAQARLQRLPDLEAPVRAQYPDYEAVVQPLVAQPERLAPHLRQFLFWHDGGPHVAYQLGKDPVLLARINQLAPAAAFLELGAMLTRPEETAAPAPPAGGLPPAGLVPTRQGDVGRPKPPPPRPLSGTGVAPVGGYREDMSQAEYRVWKKQNYSI